MDYKKIYYSLIQDCRDTPIKQRLYRRNKSDIRIKQDRIYTENHHIVPKHDGGLDKKDNMVRMLPEEHYMAHLIRWKAYNQRGDFLSVRFIVNGFNNIDLTNKNLTDEELKLFESGSINQRIGNWKNYISEFRRLRGWQTECGRARISAARAGNMPVKCALTNKMIGSVSTSHPKVISGQWVHHTKGSTSSLSTKNKHRVNNTGTGNPNYKPLSNEVIKLIFDSIDISIEENHLRVGVLTKNIKIKLSEHFNKISQVFLINRFGSYEELLNQYNNDRGTSVVYSKYFRSTSQRNHYRELYTGNKNVKN